jgi:hypothetical protein
MFSVLLNTRSEGCRVHHIGPGAAGSCSGFSGRSWQRLSPPSQHRPVCEWARHSALRKFRLSESGSPSSGIPKSENPLLIPDIRNLTPAFGTHENVECFWNSLRFWLMSWSADRILRTRGGGVEGTPAEPSSRNK